MALTHALVVKQIVKSASDAELVAIIAQWRHRHATLFANVHAHRGARSADVYVYFELAVAASLSTDDKRAFEATLATCTPSMDDRMTVDRLECMFDIPGASTGHRRMLHYVVETEAAVGWQDEMQRWYDTEHMPRLASVPGCVRARRFINHDHGPSSYACYDLARPGVTESPPWLAARTTSWSDRVRPHFRNTKRTTFSEIELPTGA